MASQPVTTYYFERKFKRLTKKDGLLKERIIRKIQEILIAPDNPFALKNLGGIFGKVRDYQSAFYYLNQLQLRSEGKDEILEVSAHM